MGKIICDVNSITLEGDYNNDVESVEVRCTKCDRREVAFGTGEASVKRCLASLNEQCRSGNFYVTD